MSNSTFPICFICFEIYLHMSRYIIIHFNQTNFILCFIKEQNWLDYIRVCLDDLLEFWQLIIGTYYLWSDPAVQVYVNLKYTFKIFHILMLEVLHSCRTAVFLMLFQRLSQIRSTSWAVGNQFNVISRHCRWSMWVT